nr:15528_t:CDS:2 [Entrophospora candida]
MSTPSSFAQPTVWAIEQMENPLILNHRPFSAFGLPVTLCYDGFAKFQEDLISINISQEDTQFVLEFVQSMSETFKNEEKRKKKHHNMLGKYLDGSIIISSENSIAIIMIIEIKPELGLGAGCPYVQASSYYADFILHHGKNSAVKVINQSCCPTFLLHITGPYLGIAGILSKENVTPEDRYQFHFPYLRSFQLNNGNISSFSYIKQIDGKLVFVVESKGNCTIVKFSRRYPKDIHLKCSELGLAPKLIAINNLEGGWKIVAMEFLDTFFSIDKLLHNNPNQADCIKSAVEKNSE